MAVGVGRASDAEWPRRGPGAGRGTLAVDPRRLMRRDPPAPRLRPKAPRWLLVLSCVTGCAWLDSRPALNLTLSQPRLEERLHAELDAVIADSLPDVSYESENPAMSEPLGRADPSLFLRKVETLDGKGRIVCQKKGRNIFGECVFPALATP